MSQILEDLVSKEIERLKFNANNGKRGSVYERETLKSFQAAMTQHLAAKSQA